MKRNNQIPSYLVIIEPPITWRGMSEYDMPTTGIVKEIVSPRVRHKDCFVRNFNAVAFDMRKFNLWAGLTLEPPFLDEVVHILSMKDGQWCD